MKTDSFVQNIVLTTDEISLYHQQGYLMLPGLIDQEALPTLRQEVLEVLEKKEGVDLDALRHGQAAADKLRQSWAYLADSFLDQMINAPNMLALASQLIGGKAIRYMPFTAVKGGHGGGAFNMHQDNNYTCHQPALGSINIWVALVDMTPDNGCLRISPMSHLDGNLATNDVGDGHRMVRHAPDFSFPVRMRAGDAVAFTRLTVHGSGSNMTKDLRLAYALQYHREDVQYHDNTSGTWRRLADDPRWNTEPLPALVND